MVDTFTNIPEILLPPETRTPDASLQDTQGQRDQVKRPENPPSAEIRALESRARHSARAIAEKKDAMLVQIEQILSEDLAKNYAELSQDQKDLFRARGEQLAREIRKAADGAPLWAHTLLVHMERWLSVLSTQGSPYWLKQEAFMRTRRILDGVLTAERGN